MVIIASFSIAAIAGIIVLFGGLDTDPAGRVLASTALIGAFSVAVFCGVVLVGKRWQALGSVTVTIATLSLGWCLRLVWDDPSWNEPTFEITATACAVTAALSVCCLLLLVGHPVRAVRAGLFVTLALVGIGVAMIVLPIWDVNPGDPYFRAMGIVWILAALGVVVLPVLTLTLKNIAPVSTEGRTLGFRLHRSGISRRWLSMRASAPMNSSPECSRPLLTPQHCSRHRRDEVLQVIRVLQGRLPGAELAER